VIRAHIASSLSRPQEPLRLSREALEEELEFDLVWPQARTLRRRVCRLDDARGRLAGWVVAWRDITREAQLARLKTEFVANVSHELRTPMAAIKGFLQVVLDDEETLPADLRHRFLSIAREETDRLSRLIEDLLDVARLESGRATRCDRPFALLELLRDVALFTRPQAEAAGLTLEFAEPAGDPWLVGDRDQIAQVLYNLVGNAIKFTAPGGVVRLALDETDDGVMLSVADTGCGIAAADLPRVFEKFYRARDTGVGPPGTGLGLAIAQQLVQSHGGKIEVSSQPGEGSLFTVWLPNRQQGATA
jgi:two-component system phosphate regulon sensor histidine kinase PhoR